MYEKSRYYYNQKCTLNVKTGKLIDLCKGLRTQTHTHTHTHTHILTNLLTPVRVNILACIRACYYLLITLYK